MPRISNAALTRGLIEQIDQQRTNLFADAGISISRDSMTRVLLDEALAARRIGQPAREKAKLRKSKRSGELGNFL